MSVFPANAPAQMPVQRVVLGESKMVEAPSSMQVVGTVNAARISNISTEIAGIVKEMPVRQGDRVEAGGVLCLLNDDALRMRLAEAEARLEALKARHAELLAGTREEELRRLEANLEEAMADFERWRFEMARIEKLYEGSDSNNKEYQDTRAAYIAAQRRMVAAEARFDEAKAGPRKEVIAQAAHEAAAQAAAVQRLKTDLEKTVIRAPFTGFVTQRRTEVGEWIAEGGQVVEMVDLRTMLVRTDAPERTFPFLSVGQTVRVTVDALGRSFDGRIKHIIPQADRTARTIPVEIELDNEDGLLASGMFARAIIPSGPRKEMVGVPKDGVVERDGVVYITSVMPNPDPRKEGMVGVRRPVTIGAEVDDWIVITSGNVEPGLPVIVRGNENIAPFPTPVLIVDPWGTPVAMPAPKKPGAVSDAAGGT